MLELDRCTLLEMALSMAADLSTRGESHAENVPLTLEEAKRIIGDRYKTLAVTRKTGR